jgi:arsenical pump membrane protein
VTVPADGVGATWGITALATAGVVTRPFCIPEAIWAILGAVVLVAFGFLSWTDALVGVEKGLDVYLFLIGMMLLAECARREGLFDWLAAIAVGQARGSPQRLFALIYVVGTIVTVLLSNDATAVVLTPAVYVATRAAGASPLPYLFICAFIANAASFVLPISNPANLVVFGARMPHLSSWLAQFAAPSVVAIAITYVALRITQRGALARETIAHNVARPRLGRGGALTAWGLASVTVVLLGCSAFDMRLGLPTFLCGVSVTAILMALTRQQPWPVLRGVSWSVLPLVAGLFVLVEGLNHAGTIALLGRMLDESIARSLTGATWGVGILAAVACNLMNNLPVGLIVGSVVATGDVPPQVISAALVGVNLGPNLSITGSLATLLWLVTLRREGLDMDGWQFLRLGFFVTTPAMIATLAAIVG